MNLDQYRLTIRRRMWILRILWLAYLLLIAAGLAELVATLALKAWYAKRM